MRVIRRVYNTFAFQSCDLEVPAVGTGSTSIYLIITECVFIVCVWEISSQLNQENGKSYGTGFFGKVQI